MTDKLIEAVARAIYSSHSMEYDHPDGWIIELESARAALAAIEASGHAIVPVEPTLEMICKGVPMYAAMLPNREWTFTRNLYAAIIAARPKVLT